MSERSRREDVCKDNQGNPEGGDECLDRLRDYLVEQKDKVILPSTKAIYQAFIDAIDRIRERLTIEDGDN